MSTARMCEVVCNLENFKFNCKADLKNFLDEKISSSKIGIEYAFIIHDKCVNENQELKKPHFHVALRFSTPKKFEQIANWFDLQPNFVSRIKGKWVDVLSYLTHANAPDKYQYDEEEVVANFDFSQVVAELLEKKHKKVDFRKEEILHNISLGLYREFNIVDYLSVHEFDKYKQSIDRAFLYRQQKLENVGDRRMKVIFIYGGSGSGKTTYAKMLAENQKYSFFVSGSSNDPFDGYKGQDCVILDDLRANVFSFTDLLKITDNHTSSSVKSRYKNKFLECQLLIITSIFKPEEFYKKIFGISDEPVLQFMRRLTNIVFLDKNYVTVYSYSKSKHKHILISDNVPNPVTYLYNFSADDINHEEEENFFNVSNLVHEKDEFPF